MPVIFELESVPNLPLDVRNLNPDRIAGLSLGEIRRLEIGFGNRTSLVSQWFRVSGDASEDEVTFKGGLENVHSIGHGLERGTIEVHGSAGRHVGASMSGGQIVVREDVVVYAGYEMTGGTIVVHGNAADYVGGCYPGAKYGMNRGTILIAGSAGKGLGHRMRRGTIVVGGDVGEHVGWQMRAGTIAVFGGCRGPVGVDLKRGTILLGTASPNEVFEKTAPTFLRGQNSKTLAVSMLLRWIAEICSRHEIEIPPLESEVAQCWHGDRLAGARGEVFTFSG